MCEWGHYLVHLQIVFMCAPCWNVVAEGASSSYDAVGVDDAVGAGDHPRVPKPMERGTVLAHLLRPELVLSNPVPLSSDAYTGFGADSAVEHNAEVGALHAHVCQQHVTSCARSPHI